MSFMEAHTYERLDLDAIRRENPLPDVVAGAGIPLKRAGREWKACCPFHNERTPSFTIFAEGQRFKCFGCGVSGDVLDFVQELHGVGLREAAEMLGAETMPRVRLPNLPAAPAKSETVGEALEIWRAALPIHGTLAETYLRSRAIACELPMSLRYAELPYGKDSRVYPCLVACVSSPEGPLQGIQRTFLAPDGLGKAEVPKPKLSLGSISGGAIRLGPLAADMVLCAGVEDGLSLVQELGRSVWAVPGDSNLASVRFPPFVKSVAVGGDNDASGRSSTEKAARAYDERGLDVRMFFPTHAKDFNEQLQQEAAQ
ncbi:MAG: CHC2 zinc finger domain-containing protein [Pseudomonadota bacterium]